MVLSRALVCSHPDITGAAIVGAADYKLSFAKSYVSEEARFEAHSKCHKRTAERLLKALLANGGAPSMMAVTCTDSEEHVFAIAQVFS